MEDRLVTADRLAMEQEEESLRPISLQEYIGQDRLKENLRIYIQAALARRIFRSCPFIWPTGFGKDNLGAYFSK